MSAAAAEGGQGGHTRGGVEDEEEETERVWVRMVREVRGGEKDGGKCGGVTMTASIVRRRLRTPIHS